MAGACGLFLILFITSIFLFKSCSTSNILIGCEIMNKGKVILCVLLAVFITGMILTPVSATKYKHKNKITVKLIDGKKIIKVKCKYKKSYHQYLGTKYKYGKKYEVSIMYEKVNGLQGGKKGWWTSATNGGMEDYAKYDYKHNKYHPITTVKLHH